MAQLTYFIILTFLSLSSKIRLMTYLSFILQYNTNKFTKANIEINECIYNIFTIRYNTNLQRKRFLKFLHNWVCALYGGWSGMIAMQCLTLPYVASQW